MDFADLDAYQALPRLSGLALSPDGDRLVTCVARLDAKKQRWVTALWEVDPAGSAPARRLTRGVDSADSPAFAADGSLLFTSKRREPDRTGEEAQDRRSDAKSELWLLPPAGEARLAGSRPGGVTGPVARAGRVVVASSTMPSALDTDDDRARRKARKDKAVNAILHRGYPVRFWDHDLGPGQPRLLTAVLDGEEPLRWTDLTPAPGRSLDEATYDLAGDGTFAVTTWSVPEDHGSLRTSLRVVDTASGHSRTLADRVDVEWGLPRISPDGAEVAALRWTRSTPTDPGDCVLAVLALDGSAERVVSGWDRWPTDLRWTPDGSALLVTADEQGRAPVFRVEGDEVTRLTTDDGAYTDLCASPDGAFVYALRSGYDGPPAPVRIDAHVPGPPTVLPLDGLPGARSASALPGSLTEVTARAGDGRPLRAWLAVPEGDGPHPLVLWVHGGPLGSWNAWSWRWCPWLLVARGYAVLLPDPALSTGYGLDHVAAGWGRWGALVFDDLMQVLDAALLRPDLDGTRTAAMGGSFGGYMANWIAGHTDRFRAIVTHAALWGLERFGSTTDAAWYWRREMTPQMVAANDPSASADAISTPMLVVHGDKDYRVPVGEALSLWWDLCSRWGDPDTLPHRFLYFPDENHWILTPGHATVWYETVLAFLDQHVLGRDEVVPDLLA